MMDFKVLMFYLPNEHFLNKHPMHTDLELRKILKVKGIVNKDKGIYASCVWGSQAESVYTSGCTQVYRIPIDIQCLQCLSGESMPKKFPQILYTLKEIFDLPHEN